MENENIQEILKKKISKGSFKEGAQLYSPFFGDCILSNVDAGGVMVVERKDSHGETLGCSDILPDGTAAIGGEVMLFPSKEMRNWHCFAWEAYSILKRRSGKTAVFFESWADKSYTEFNGCQFRRVDGRIQKQVKKYRTLNFVEASEEFASKFCTTLYYQIGAVISELNQFCPLYKKIVGELRHQAELADEEAKMRDKEMRKPLENLTRRALVTDEYSERNKLVKGSLYYFEDADAEGITCLAQYAGVSDDKKIAYFSVVIECNGDSTVCRGNVEKAPDHCLNFRKVTDEEENKFKQVLNDLKNSFVSFIEGKDYTFCLEGEFFYFGKLVSVKEDKSNFVLRDVYCCRRRSKPMYFPEKKFITSQCEKLREVSADERYFFDGVIESYKESQTKPSDFKPKDWCLMRDFEDQWDLCQFAYCESPEGQNLRYVAVGGMIYSHCIPYEGNEYLLGTTKTPEYGEK